MSEEFPQSEDTDKSVDMSRRNFLKSSILAAGVLASGNLFKDVEAATTDDALSGSELEAQIDGIAREIEQRETILNELLHLSDSDIDAINNGTFTRDPVVYAERRISLRDEDETLPQENFNMSQGAVVGAGAGAVIGGGWAALGHSGQETTDEELIKDVKGSATTGAGIGAAAGIYMGHRNETAASKQTQVEYSGLLSSVLGPYRERGAIITRDDIASEVKEQSGAIEYLRDKRTRYKNLRGDSDAEEPGRFYRKL